MQLVFGHGEIEVAPVEQEGRHGLLLRKLNTAHKVGAFIGNGNEEVQYNEDTDVILWFDTLEGARVLQDGVNVSVLDMVRKVYR